MLRPQPAPRRGIHRATAAVLILSLAAALVSPAAAQLVRATTSPVSPVAPVAPVAPTERPPPVITGMDHAAGPPEGGTRFEVRGWDLETATAVFVDGLRASFGWSSEVLVVTSPPHAPGRAVVVVESASGTSDPTPSGANTFLYTITDAPVIGTVRPTAGTELGGTEVTITGSNIDNATDVLFGTTPAASFRLSLELGYSRLLAIAPPHTPGPVDVVVRNAHGDSVPLPEPFVFQVQPPPRVASVAPIEGPAEGGSIVELWGDGFLAATSVRFGDVEATTFAVDGDRHLKATVPPAADRWHDSDVPVIVTTARGSSTSSPTDRRYRYRVGFVPVIAGLWANHGSTAGGQLVRITGHGFTGATSVRFGTIEAAFTVNTDMEMVATAPAVDAPYLYNVTVTTPLGATAPTPASWYLYRRAPVVRAVDANHGSVAGGETVRIIGDQFLEVSSVSIGWHEAAFQVVDQHTIVATVPAGYAGTAWVIVTTAEGRSAVTLKSLYAYRDPSAPVVTGVERSRGSTAGGETVVLTGSGFAGANAVLFENLPATSFTVESDTQIVAVTPARPTSALVNIRVDTDHGSNPNAPPSWYLYEAR